jgi:hypothetical protein
VIKTGDEWKCSFDLDWPPASTTTKLTIKSQAGAADEGVIVRFDFRGSH